MVVWPLSVSIASRHPTTLCRPHAQQNTSFNTRIVSQRKEAAGKYDSQEENDLGADRTWQYSNCTLGLILSTDGKGIVMRQEALREVTRKAAETKHHKLEKRLSRGEKANRKRMSTVASVYDVERHVRSAESIMKLEEAKVEQASPPRAREKRVWASVERDQSQNWLGPRFVVLFGP